MKQKIILGLLITFGLIFASPILIAIYKMWLIMLFDMLDWDVWGDR